MHIGAYRSVFNGVHADDHRGIGLTVSDGVKIVAWEGQASRDQMCFVGT